MSSLRKLVISFASVAVLLLSAHFSAAVDPPANEKPTGESPAEEKPTEMPRYEVHHFGVWLTDPALNKVNAREQFTSGFPLTIETSRPRRLKKDKTTTSPMNVIAFRGQPLSTLEIELRVQSGGFVGHWPSAQTKNNRLRWLDYQLATDPPGNAAFATVTPEHWFAKARDDKSNLVIHKGARTERFLTYDVEANVPLPVKLEGGPDKYQLRSTVNYPLYDVVIVAPGEGGRRIGWLDELAAAHEKKPAGGKPSPAEAKPAATTESPQPQPGGAAPALVVGAAPPAVAPATAGAQQPNPQPAATPEGQPGPPVDVEMSKPLAADSDEWAGQSKAKLVERLGKAGLTQSEVDVIVSTYEPAIFSSDSLVVTWRLPSGMVDEINMLTFEPEPSKTTRVVLVIARNLDPKIASDLQKYVDELGSPDYKLRETAEQRLNELGSLALPVLKKALAHKDPEIAFRAERLLLEQQQPIDVPK